MRQSDMNTLKKPPSQARLLANRANAKKSTGPRTVEGKQRSARNAITHGLTSRDLTALGEDFAALPEIVQALNDSWNPRNPFEASLIKNLATLQIRLDRCVRMETGLLDMDIPEVTRGDSRETCNSAVAAAFVAREASFMNYSRYEANLSRAFDRTLKQLLAVRKEKPLPVEPSPDETNPICIENNDPPPAPEPTPPSLRFDLEPPATPADSLDRRMGKFIPFPEREPHTTTLVWLREDEEEDPQSGGRTRP